MFDVHVFGVVPVSVLLYLMCVFGVVPVSVSLGPRVGCPTP